MPRPTTSLALSIRFCDNGFSMTTLRAFAGPTRFGSSQQPPQPGSSPRKVSGRAKAGTPAETVR